MKKRISKQIKTDSDFVISSDGIPFHFFYEKNEYQRALITNFFRPLNLNIQTIVSLLQKKFLFGIDVLNRPLFHSDWAQLYFSNNKTKYPFNRFLNEQEFGDSKILLSHTSRLKEISEEITTENIRRLFLTTITTRNVLHEQELRTIGKNLGLVPHQYFLPPEIGLIAWHCGKSGSAYHLNEERVIAEIVDKNNVSVAPGETGDLVMTILDLSAMPFIRYKNGERGRLVTNSCPCGRALRLIEIETPVYQLIRLPEGGSVSHFALRDAFISEGRISKIKKINLQQTGLTSLKIDIQVDSLFSEINMLNARLALFELIPHTFDVEIIVK
jgi:phenylacetate-CoA ligase